MPTGLGSRPTFSCSHPRSSNDRIHRGRRDRAAREWVLGCSRSALPVVREDVISGLHDRVAREPALGVVPLRRLVSRRGGRKRIRRGVILERAPSPTAAVPETPSIPYHEI